jgi:hypothetical protein
MTTDFKADRPDYVPDYGMAGKGAWLLLATGVGKPVGSVWDGVFGPFPSDEDAIEFAGRSFPVGRFGWLVTRLVDPRDPVATRRALDALIGEITP